MFEIKDPVQPKHRHELTPAQVEFHAGWRGDLVKIFTAKEALQYIGALRGTIS